MVVQSPIYTTDADATQLSSWVASAVCIEFATSWRQPRRVWTICRQRSRVASCRRCERASRQSWPSFQFSAPVTYRLQNCKLGHDSRRCVHTADATQLDSWVASASAVCMGHNIVPKFSRCIVRFSIGYSIVSDTKSFTCATGEWWQTDRQTDRHTQRGTSSHYVERGLNKSRRRIFSIVILRLSGRH